MSTWNPLFQALARNAFCESELSLLLTYKSEITALGSTALHFAALRGDARFVQFLLQQEGIRVNTQNFYGETALHWAVKADREHAITCLLDLGAQSDLADADGGSPIDWASEEDHSHLLPLLRKDKPRPLPALLQDTLI